MSINQELSEKISGQLGAEHGDDHWLTIWISNLVKVTGTEHWFAAIRETEDNTSTTPIAGRSQVILVQTDANNVVLKKIELLADKEYLYVTGARYEGDKIIVDGKYFNAKRGVWELKHQIPTAMPPNKRILYLEDLMTMGTILRDKLTKLLGGGTIIEHVATFEEAVAKVRSAKYDLVLSDVNLRSDEVEIDTGFDFYDQNKDYIAKILMLSANPKYAQNAHERGIDFFDKNMISFEEDAPFVEKVRSALAE